MIIQPSKPILHLWAMANAEAWFCQGDAIEPAHFWVAALKLADTAVAAAMLDAGAGAAECQEQADAAKALLAYLEMDAEAAKTLRRTLRGRLLRGREPRALPDGPLPYLHRSESSRRLFEIAFRKATERNAPALTPLHLVETLFDMQLASLGPVS